MKSILLTKNYEAKVDDEDFVWLSKYRWHYDRGYAARTIHDKGIEYMHRMINKTPKGLSTDHVNGDRLDNRKNNLRSCTQTLNNANSKLRRSNTSGYKGVVWHKKDTKWQAQLTKHNKLHYLGQFTDKIEAAKAYNRAAIQHFGEFAVLNEV